MQPACRLAAGRTSGDHPEPDPDFLLATILTYASPIQDLRPCVGGRFGSGSPGSRGESLQGDKRDGDHSWAALKLAGPT
jgi:hypothetical protein